MSGNGSLSTILDVAIGIVFIYGLASLVITSLTEFLSTLLRFRGSLLAAGITQLLHHPEFAKKFFEHPLIKTLSQPNITSIKALASRLPSQIPARTFALVVSDIVGKDADGNPEIAKVSATFGGDSGVQLQRILSLLWESADKKHPEFLTALERTYTDVTDRMSGWYKRRADRVVFALAVGLTLLLNIDTIHIIKTLWNDPAARAALVAEAEAYSAERAKSLASSDARAAEAQKPPPPDVPDMQREVTIEDMKAASERVNTAYDRLTSLSFPLGWYTSKSPAAVAASDSQGYWDRAINLLREHLIGWSITALALTLGAPFWFDMLSKLISIRNAGKNTPATKPPSVP